MTTKTFELTCYTGISANGKFYIANADDIKNIIQIGDKEYIHIYEYNLGVEQICLEKDEDNELLIITAEEHPDEPVEIEVRSFVADSIEQLGINDIVINNETHIRLANIIHIGFDDGKVKILTAEIEK